jgi:hypothetical protein
MLNRFVIVLLPINKRTAVFRFGWAKGGVKYDCITVAEHHPLVTVLQCVINGSISEFGEAKAWPTIRENVRRRNRVYILKSVLNLWGKSFSRGVHEQDLQPRGCRRQRFGPQYPAVEWPRLFGPRKVRLRLRNTPTEEDCGQ